MFLKMCYAKLEFARVPSLNKTKQNKPYKQNKQTTKLRPASL